MTVHKLIVLRHGQSEGNDENKFCGWLDVPLTEKGKKDAEYAGELIKQNNLSPDILYTSKLIRSIETGFIILKVLNKPWIDHIKSWRLNERHYGKYQGRNRHDVFMELNQDKKLFQYIRRNYNGLPPLIDPESDTSIDEKYNDLLNKDILPRGESLHMVMDRLIPFFKYEILDNQMIQLNKTVLIVTHGSIVRSLIKYLNKVDDDDISKIEIPTGVPLVFELNDKGDLIKPYYYLDKEKALEGSEESRNAGLKKKL
ncbi:GPM2 [Candida pseudojiufengensis]|uniref:GPM2 n=1 Tax=Candida pseudojiufengensis TaxID=497109 RepID=UPI002224B3C1|nr:GPM2 [Candida pseudojiufengensis]KAI5960334.1 GPM2 [Candida pseudojiufengensis]